MAVVVGLFVGLGLRAVGLAVAVAEMELVLVQMQPTTGLVEVPVAATVRRVWVVMVSKGLFWSK